MSKTIIVLKPDDIMQRGDMVYEGSDDFWLIQGLAGDMVKDLANYEKGNIRVERIITGSLETELATLRAQVTRLEAEREAATIYINTLEGLVDHGYILYGQHEYQQARAAREEQGR